MKPGHFPPRAVIFDLDGTLADTFELVVHAWNVALEETTGRVYSPEDVIARFGPPESAMIRLELKDHSQDVRERAMAIFLEAYERDHHIAAPFQGIPELLEELQNHGIPMAVVTGKGRDTLEVTMRVLGWTGYFRCLVSGDDVAIPKPDPEGPLKAARFLGVEPSQCVFIGDSPADVGAGNASGMTTIAAGWHAAFTDLLREAGPDYWADSPADVMGLLGWEPTNHGATVRGDKS